MIPPAVVLVRPQMGENIGASARLMMNFGLEALRLVAPRDGWPNEKAHEMAANADGIIERAHVHATLGDALGEATLVLAASARPREMTLPCYTPREAAEVLHAHQGACALVFGPENNGLSNDDLAACHGVVTIPTHSANRSLNLAQSVGILAYEWFLQTAQPVQQAEQSEPAGQPERASAAQVVHLYDALVEALQAAGYFSQGSRAPSMRRSLRAMLTRLPLSAQDVHSLRGMLRALHTQRR